MTMRSKQWYTKTSRLEYSFAKSSIGRRSSDRVLTTRSSVRQPVESKFQIYLARLVRRFFVQHDAQGNVKRLESELAEVVTELLDTRLMTDCGVRIGRAGPGVGR